MRDVITGENVKHAGHAFRYTRIDWVKRCRGIGGAHNQHHRFTRQAMIIGIKAATGDEARIGSGGNRLAD